MRFLFFIAPVLGYTCRDLCLGEFVNCDDVVCNEEVFPAVCTGIYFGIFEMVREGGQPIYCPYDALAHDVDILNQGFIDYGSDEDVLPGQLIDLAAMFEDDDDEGTMFDDARGDRGYIRGLVGAEEELHANEESEMDNQ